jgi:hypothetical protein
LKGDDISREVPLEIVQNRKETALPIRTSFLGGYISGQLAITSSGGRGVLQE